MEKHLYNLDEIPKDHRSIFESINETIKAAFSKPGQLKRNAPGNYYIVLDNELVHIVDNSYEGSQYGWIARKASQRAEWYTDYHPTLRELKKELGI